MRTTITGRATRRRARACALLLVTAAGLAGCSADEPDPETDAAASESADSAAATASPSLEVPTGVSLTEQGSELELGETAQVAWSPREDKVGVVEIRVDAVEEVSLEEFAAFKVGDAARSSTPYFVRMRIENIGDTFLGNVGVPLYLLDGTDTLIERSSFGSSFEACPSEPLPETFKVGATTETCLVFLAPRRGEAEAVSFRPTEEDVPITWTGDITEPRDQGRGRRQGQRQGQGQGGSDQPDD